MYSKKLVPLELISSLDWQVLEGIGMDKTVYDFQQWNRPACSTREG
jgi:hypothetical protein